jgi:hypothetical protein
VKVNEATWLENIVDIATKREQATSLHREMYFVLVACR